MLSIHHVILPAWYLLILSACYMLGAMHSAEKSKNYEKAQSLSTNLSWAPWRGKLAWNTTYLFWVGSPLSLCTGNEVGMQLTNRKEEKSFSALAPANTFNHFKLQLETELEGNLVESPFVNKSPARRQIAFLPMKSLVPEEHTFKSNPSLQASLQRKERPHRKCSVIGHPGRSGTKPGSILKP